MIRESKRWIVTIAFGAACALASATLGQAQSITFIGSTTGSDYSDSGLDLGNAGFWFAQFAAQQPISGAAIDSNQRSQLPSWVTLNPAPGTTFSSSATTKGGNTPWAFLTLPNGENGLSGAVVDSGTAGNSNNTIAELVLGPGVPNSFFFHVVTDNTAGEHDPASRLRARAEKLAPGDFDISGPNAPAGLGANMDGLPDVYTFRYDGMVDGAYIKLQLNSGSAAEQASIAGFMFDAVPEPASGIAAAIASMGLMHIARRRQS